jgi:hypothetical protein
VSFVRKQCPGGKVPLYPFRRSPPGVALEFEELEDWEGGVGTDLRSSSSQDLHADLWATLRVGSLTAIREEMLDGVLRRVAAPGREPRADIKRNAEVMVSTIIANLILLHQLRPEGSSLVVDLANTKKTRYDRKGFQKLSPAIDALQDMGLVDKFPGDYRRYRTTLQARGKLLEAVTSSPALLADVIRAEGQELIVLTARPRIKRDNYGKKHPKIPLDYADDEETRRLRAEIEALNRFLSAADITFRGNVIPEIGLYRTFTLRREADPHIFNLHGRLYGGFWINLPKGQREDLRIDGGEVADLDFTAMFPSLAYIRAGQAPPEGDPYAIKGLDGYRSGAKAAMSAFLSAGGPQRVLPDGMREKLPDGWSIKRLREAILEHHPVLADSFEQDLSLEFMFTESRIMMRALSCLVAQGVTALPIHDGMMVASSKADIASAAMMSASYDECGHTIQVVQK